MKKENGFIREEGFSGLKSFNTEHGTFDDYTAESGVAAKFTSKRKKTELITKTLIDSKTKHCHTASEINEFATANPEVDILVNEEGNQAKMEEICYVNEDISWGRQNGVLELS